jgi:hypothetical protein
VSGRHPAALTSAPRVLLWSPCCRCRLCPKADTHAAPANIQLWARSAPHLVRSAPEADIESANYGGSKSQKSFKASIQRLEGSLRNIADMHLHMPIRAREDVPTATQVDFAAELDVLLGEVIRVSQG